MTFPARYPGECVECDQRIDVGDPIENTVDGWIHAQCDTTPTDAELAGTSCTTCWLVGPCDCDKDT